MKVAAIGIRPFFFIARMANNCLPHTVLSAVITLLTWTSLCGGVIAANDLTYNGDAAPAQSADGIVLRLVPATTTQRGSVFSTRRVDADAFTSYFSFRFTDTGGALEENEGADGFVFVIQAVSSNALSNISAGSALGYGGIQRSAGIEFDIFHSSGFNDSDDSHIAMVVDGEFPTSYAPISILPDMKNGDLWHVWIDYTNLNMEVRVSLSDTRPSAPTLTHAINLADILESDSGYVGFTAATGGAYANHDIIEWNFNSQFDLKEAFQSRLEFADNITQLRVYGIDSFSYTIEYTEDLMLTMPWTFCTNCTLTTNPLTLNVLPPTDKTAIFYRCVPQ